MARVILAFGANIKSPFGGPEQSLMAAVSAISEQGIVFDHLSSLYRSPPVGPTYQQPFINLVMACRTRHSPRRLLSLIKHMEHGFGRRGELHWGPRPLDIDIIDYDNKIQNWHGGVPDEKAPLILPHPRLHLRPFVLHPLEEILPGWRHPVFKLTPSRMKSLYCSNRQLKLTEKLEIG